MLYLIYVLYNILVWSFHSKLTNTSLLQVGSRTLPEGRCWTKVGWQRYPFRSYPIPEHATSEWTKSRPQSNEEKKPQTGAVSHNYELKHIGTNTNSISTSEKHARTDLRGTRERQSVEPGGGREREPLSGIGGPATGPANLHGVNKLSVDRAEHNWNRRGPSPIQRNMLARKLKEAQSNSGVKGRQRSSTFSVSSSEQRKGRCQSLPMSDDYISSAGSSYKLSEAEQRMLDLDLPSACVQEEITQ